MPFPAGTTTHAHFGRTPADPILGRPVRQGGQSDHTARRATSNMTQIELLLCLEFISAAVTVHHYSLIVLCLVMCFVCVSRGQ
jgi:hypothetical protein